VTIRVRIPALLLTLSAEREHNDDEAKGSVLAGFGLARVPSLGVNAARLGERLWEVGGNNIFHLGGVGSNAGRAACATRQVES